VIVRLISCLALAAAISCKSSKEPTAAPGAGDRGDSGETGAAGERGAPAVALAESPTIDLLANRYLVHAGAPGQLAVPLAAEGVRKYSQEYSSPWGDVIEVDGERGRVLGRRAAILRVPHDGGDAAVHVRVHGAAAGQRLTLEVNGERVATQPLEPAWQTVSFPPVKLRDGENQIIVAVARAGSVGGKKSHGLWHSLWIGGDAEGVPPLEPVADVSAGGEARSALTGYSRLRYHLEIPKSGHLVVATGVTEGEAQLTVAATPVGGERQVLWSGRQKPGWKDRRVPLADLAGRLVALDLETDTPGAVGWADARVALEKAEIAPRPEPIDNVILLVVDALRSDRLAAYGETRVTTPRITAETEARGAVFLHNQAASPSSPPSHGSIQTGMIPRVNGVAGDKAQLVPGTPMLSTQARAAGIEAAYYGNNPFGMARLEKPGNWTAFHQPAREGKSIDCTALMDEMLGFSERMAKAEKRFVISSLPYEPHTPYRYHEGISDKYHPGPWGPPVGKSVDGHLLGALSDGRTTLDEAQWSQLRALYDGEVTYFDGCFATLLDGLDKIGIGDRTAIVMTSDHGEGMFEHGKMGHAFGHWAELGNVPFIIYSRGLTDGGRRLDVVTSHLDITPTILDLLGAEVSDRVQGRSAIPMILRRGPWTPRVVSLEYGRSYSLRAAGWRYIVDYDGTESLYDVAADPTEQVDLVKSAKHAMALRYLRDLAGFFLAHRSQWTAERWGDLNNHSPRFASDHGPG
jgi:arylsulfatase A-like enzyme